MCNVSMGFGSIEKQNILEVTYKWLDAVDECSRVDSTRCVAYSRAPTLVLRFDEHTQKPATANFMQIIWI